MISLSKGSNKNQLSTDCKVQLTSLVDVMTILLVFLLKSFSADGNTLTQSNNLHLPVSSANTPVRIINNLKITEDAIMSNDTIITSIGSVKASDSLVIPSLLQWFKTHGTNGKEIMIQSDKNQPFDVVKKVMFTCSQAAITDFTILVLREE